MTKLQIAIFTLKVIRRLLIEEQCRARFGESHGTKVNLNQKSFSAFNRMDTIANLLQHPLNSAAASWYKAEREELESIATEYGLSSEVVTAVVAHMSPQMKWPENKAVTVALLDAHARGLSRGEMHATVREGFPANREKSWDVLESGDPQAAKFGPKTGSFFANLLGDPQAVTVDRHHAMAMRGRSSKGDVALSIRAYDIARSITRYVANIVGMTPADFQASIWVARREALGIID